MTIRPPATSHSFTVPLRGTFDPVLSLEHFRRNGEDLLDRWDGERFARTIPSASGPMPYSCRFERTPKSCRVQVQVGDPSHQSAVAESIKSTFTPGMDSFPDLLAADPVLEKLHKFYPGVWTTRQFDLFTGLVRCISAQQINLKWAATIRKRLAEQFGIRHEVDGCEVYSLDPVKIASAAVADIRALQFTDRKSETVIGVARAVVEGSLDAAALSKASDDEVIETLCQFKGIGRWTSEWILARTMGRPRVVAGDLGVRKVFALAYFDGEMPTEEAVRERTLDWGDAAGAAQTLLLHALAEPGSPIQPPPKKRR